VHAFLICRLCELRKLFSFLFTPFLRTFQQPNPFCCNRSTTNLFMISFLSRKIDFFFFFLSLWIYLWLAETSQQPISQTTWLKFPPLVIITRNIKNGCGNERSQFEQASLVWSGGVLHLIQKNKACNPRWAPCALFLLVRWKHLITKQGIPSSLQLPALIS